MKQFKVVVEKHEDGYIAYPLGMRGVVVGQGDTYEEALDNVKSAIRFHLETFSEETLVVDPQDEDKMFEIISLGEGSHPDSSELHDDIIYG